MTDIPQGMVAWHGGDRAPDDLDDSKPLRFRDGYPADIARHPLTTWAHSGGPGDIIAYTPRAALAQPEAALVGVSITVVRDIDVPKGAWPWIEEIGLTLEGPHRRLETPRDHEAIVLWHDEKPAAFVLNLRDQFNRSIQYRVDLRATPAPRNANETGQDEAEATVIVCRYGHKSHFAGCEDCPYVHGAYAAKPDHVKLIDCPIGLFWRGDTLALKTEYGNNEGRIDAYIVSSGEFFWGPAPQTIASQRATLVTPIDTDFACAALATQPAASVDAQTIAKIIHDECENDDDSDGGAYLRAARKVRSLLATQPAAGSEG